MIRALQPAPLLLLLALSVTSALSQSAHPADNSGYYPLAKGNSWTYQVRNASTSRVSTVEWRVTSADKTKEGIVYQVWPTPADSDDEAMTLQVSPSGLQEVSSGVLIPKLPIAAGDSWTSADPAHHRRFKILLAGQPCHSGIIESGDCISVQDDDDRLRFRTVTTYARGIGPIRYEYFEKDGKSGRPSQTVELLSYPLISR
jgi:hypothetical protein